MKRNMAQKMGSQPSTTRSRESASILHKGTIHAVPRKAVPIPAKMLLASAMDEAPAERGAENAMPHDPMTASAHPHHDRKSILLFLGCVKIGMDSA